MGVDFRFCANQHEQKMVTACAFRTYPHSCNAPGVRALYMSRDHAAIGLGRLRFKRALDALSPARRREFLRSLWHPGGHMLQLQTEGLRSNMCHARIGSIQ